MGNCVVLPNKDINIFRRADCKVLESKVHQILSKFRSHAAASDTLPSVRQLHPDADHEHPPLLPLLVLPKHTAGEMTGVVRIKLVISKQELKALLQKGRIIVDDKLPQLQKNAETNEVDILENKTSCMGWKPTLQSIPE